MKVIPSIPPGHTKLTVAELADLPNDGKRYEIIDGELYVTPAPVPRHQKISRRLQTLLVLQLEQQGKGEVYDAPIDLVLDDHTAVQPDLLFISAGRLQIIGEKNIQGAPDLVVEILSPTTRRTDVLVKSRHYASFGIRSYWIVDPDLDRIEFFRLDGNAYVLAEARTSPEVAEPAELPGLRIPLAEVFG